MTKHGHQFKGMFKTSNYFLPKDWMDKTKKGGTAMSHLVMDPLKDTINVYSVG